MVFSRTATADDLRAMATAQIDGDKLTSSRRDSLAPRRRRLLLGDVHGTWTGTAFHEG